ncbi:MAG: Multidrug resistance-like ATP-binding protein MdlB [Candidatus Celerinatantimonas neptuna]|nr:MAG: Multidrug resistance-like ATP-binding protein MdlB [Candidatus Celerinatantimonas neptuna]
MSKPSEHRSGTFRLLMGYVIADRGLLAKAIFLLVLATGLDVLGPILAKIFIDDFIVPDRYPIWPIAAIIIAFIATKIIGTILRYQQTLKFTDIALAAVLDIRKRVFHHVLKLPMAYFDHARTGQLVSRITNDTESIKDLYVQFLSIVLTNVILLVGILISMAILDFHLMLVALALIPTVIGLIYIYQKLSGAAVAKSRQLRSDINAVVSESIGGMAVIQATNQQQNKLAQFDDTNSGYYWARLRTVQIGSFLLRPAISLLSILVLVGVIWIFGIQVVQGVAEIGVLYAFLNYLGRFTEPLADITQRFNLYQQAMVAGDRVYSLLNEPSIVDHSEHQSADMTQGALSIQNLQFAYLKGKPILKNINIEIPAGRFYAIVGHTGSGKSTLLSLLLNFYQPQQGKICIDGYPLDQFDHDTLRNGVGLIPQEPFILASTIFDNIDMGRKLTPQQIEQAARQAHLHQVIEQMSDGYRTHLGEGGLRLSTGQRQQLIIARALAGSPRILLLDEATASVDSETEQVVQRALDDLRGKVTMIVVAHRLSTINHADQILVLSHGEIAEQGSHNQLMRKTNGLYQSMYQLQQQAQKITQLEESVVL